jgi:hypothetical protein
MKNNIMSYTMALILLMKVNGVQLPATSKLTKDALDSQPQVIKFTSCLPMVGGSLQVLRLLPPLKLVAMI